MELGAWSTALPPRGFLLTRAKATSEDSVPSRSSSPPADDEAEWKAVVAAFKMYKAAYGDLKVPQRFVVPTLPPWPKPAQGLRLGKLVQDIRATGKFLDPRQSPRTLAARRQILEDLGFVWRVRQEPLAVPPQQPLPTQTPFQPEGSAVASSSSVSSPRPADIPPPQAVLSSSTTSSASSSSNALEGAALRPDGGSQVVPLEQLYRALQAYRQLVVLPQQQRLLPSEPPQLYWEVPSAFIVPNVPPWPETVRGLPLGLQVQYLRRRVARNRFVRDKFAALGIASVAAPDDGPRAGGTRASAAGGSRSSESANAGADDDQAAADKATANDVRFRNVYVALQAYKAAYGDLLVPQPFTVPKTPDWPPETWGLRLGARVNAIRSQGTFVNNNPERRVILDELGFVWSTPKERSRRGRRPATAEEENDRPTGSVGVHNEDNGDNGEEEDEEEGNNDESPASDSTLDSLFDDSFDFGMDWGLADGSRKTAPTWGLAKGAADFPESYASMMEEPPEEEDYAQPRSLSDSLKEATEKALQVGVIEGLTPNKRVIKGKQQKDIPWFNDDFGGDFVFEDVVEGLKVYKSIYGDLSNLTDDFVVPNPKEVTGFVGDDDDFFDDDGGGGFLDSFSRFDVDASARAAAAIANYERQGDVRSGEELVGAEIRRLREEIGQPQAAVAARAPISASTTSETATWPEALAGMQLGSIAARIRDGSLEVKHVPERKRDLDAIKFDWGDPERFIDVPFEKAMCAFYAYYLIRGDMFVYEDFVMPDEDPWPQALAGYEIGKAVTRIRELQNFLEAYHPEKVTLLRMIDFVWFPTMALPLDPQETEMNTERLLLSAMGHPDYAKMIDIPMGLPDRIIADGPFFDTDDPKLWWRKWHNWDYVKDYWYQQGRRDNAYVLRQLGYPQMADEHEAKYGPGLLAQINETLESLASGVEGRTLDEKREILETLDFYRQEMIGCTDIHPHDREKLIAEFDMHMMAILKDPRLRVGDSALQVGDPALESDFDSPVNGARFTNSDAGDEEEEYDDDDSDVEVTVEDFEIDIEDELGLGLQ